MFDLKLISKFKEGPQTFKYAVLLLCLGWAMVYLSYYLLFPDDALGRELYLLLGVGLSICILVAAARPWARKMVLFFNIAIVLFFSILAYNIVLVEKILFVHILSVFIIFSFIASTYFLFKKDTGAFFLLHAPGRQDSPSSDAEKA